MPLESVNFSYSFVSGRANKPGVGSLTLFALRDAAATVAANVVKAYRTAAAVLTDHGVNSTAYAASQLVVQNLQGKFRIGTFAYKTALDVADRTFGTASAITTGTLPAAALPLYSVATVSRDGTPLTTIVYTNKVPNVTNFPSVSATTIVVNPSTGVWYTPTATTGSGAGVVFGTVNTPDLTALKAQALMQPIEVVTFAGMRYNTQTWGLYNDLVSWASTNNLMVYAGLDDSIAAPTASSDSESLITAIRSDSFQVLAAKMDTTTLDLTSAYAALQAASPPNGTLKKQPAPRGITYASALPYTRDEFGDDVDPSTGTFHYSGANVVTLDGDFVISSDRCMTLYSTATSVLFGGVRRTLNATNALVQFYVDQALTATGAATPIFDEIGLNAIEGAARNGLNSALQERYIRDSFILRFPDLEDTLEADRKKRLLTGIQYDITVTTAMHVVDFTVEVGV